MASKNRYERITITMPKDVLAAIESVAPDNRSGFLATAARREVRRQRRKALLDCLDARVFTEEDRTLEAAGLSEYEAQLPDDDLDQMVDQSAIEPVQWVRGQGWIKP